MDQETPLRSAAYAACLVCGVSAPPPRADSAPSVFSDAWGSLVRSRRREKVITER